ncbi:MAG: YdcF family protein [Candidatus Taylorbacteria bacterium]|nr:YdcF family protein [Candidatus Taylorbacteria bacterium]
MLKIAKKILWSILFFIVFVMAIYEIPVIYFSYSQGNLRPADAILVLGSGYMDVAKDRAMAGLKLYEKGLAPVIIFAGGKTNYPKSEALFMSEYIKSQSSSTPPVILEENSKSTYENLVNVRNILESKSATTTDIRSIIIVSNNFHLFRSYLIAKNVGFESVEWYSADGAGGQRAFTFTDKVKNNFNEFIKLIGLLQNLLHL